MPQHWATRLTVSRPNFGEVAARGLGAEIHAAGGDACRTCDPSGLNAEDATRQLKTVERTSAHRH